jgi:hypothetical protein
VTPPKGRPARLHPAYGGEPLPRPPIIMPYMPMHAMAAAYVKVLRAELDYDDQPKWNGAQRAQIKRKWADWTLKAQGLDAHFNKHGTHRRPFNADPPGPAEWYQETLRRREEDRTGVKASSRARRDKFKCSAPYQVKKIVKRWQKQYGTGTVTPTDD